MPTSMATAPLSSPSHALREVSLTRRSEPPSRRVSRSRGILPRRGDPGDAKPRFSDVSASSAPITGADPRRRTGRRTRRTDRPRRGATSKFAVRATPVRERLPSRMSLRRPAATRDSRYPWGHFRRNQLPGDSIGLSPLLPLRGSDLHVSTPQSVRPDFSGLPSERE